MKILKCHEAEIHFLDDNTVKKIYRKIYYIYNELFHRKGEIYFLQKYKSPYFIKLLDGTTEYIIEEFGGIPLGNVKNIIFDKLDVKLFINWLNGLKKELQHFSIKHQDINPTNILFNEETNSFVLIDFSWACENSDQEMHKSGALNPFAKDDNEAINKLINIAKSYYKEKELEESKNLIKLIGVGHYRDGSSLAKGHTYHEIPFEEYKDIKYHKKIAPTEYKEILNHGHISNWKNKKILDIGCSIGYHTFKLAEKGANIIACDADGSVINAAKAIQKYKEISNIDFIHIILDETNIPKSNFDLILCLNTFMWIHKQIGTERSLEFLKNLSSKTEKMLFQTSHAESQGMYTIKEFKNINDIKKFLEKGNFKVTHIRDTKQHGGIRALFYCESI